MIRRLVLGAMLLVALVDAPVRAVGRLRPDELRQRRRCSYVQLRSSSIAQLVTTYQQIRTQYLLLKQQAEKLPFSLEARYRSLGTPWLPLVAPSAYGTTANWIDAANTGQCRRRRLRARHPGAGVLRRRPRGPVGRRDRARRDALRPRPTRGRRRSRTASRPSAGCGSTKGPSRPTIRNLEADAYSDDPALHTQIAVLNKINATGVTAARMAKDTNYVLVSLLEQQVLEATERREAAVQGINAHVAFLTEARPLLARTTADTTTALTTFRIP